MSVNFPSSWIGVSLGRILNDIVGGGTPSKNISSNFNGTIPFMTVKDMTVSRPENTIDHINKEALNSSSARLIPADTIVIATRMGLGKIVRPKMEIAINQDLKAIFPAEGINKDFLEKWFISIASYIEQNGKGTTVKGVRLEFLKELLFPLPPANEQSRIVSKIEELFSDLDAGEAALRKAQQLIEMYRQSVLKAAVTGELTREWREKSSSRPIDSLLAEVKQLRKKLWKGKYKESPKPKTDGLPELPQSWTWLSLGELSYFITSGSRGWAEYYADKGSYFLRSQNIGKQGFKLNDIAYVIPPKSAEGLRTKLQLDDLVLSITGEPGNVARTTEREANGYISQHVALIRLCKPNMAKYIELCIRSKIGEKYFEKVRYGATKPGLNLTQVAECPIAIPSLAEQEEIVRLTNSLMSAIDNIEMSINEQAARFSSLRQSILKQAFEGKLVPQDPADEPASELLKRISTQSSQPKAARGRKKKAAA